MNIVFFCQGCGSRFEVAPASAGKQGRCKHCGQMLTIPMPRELASVAALPALSPADAGDGRPLSWLASAPVDVALAPLTVDGPSIGRANRPVIDDDLGDSKPYDLGRPMVPALKGSTGGHAAGGLVMLWRRELGVVQKFFRWLNETAYLLSVPFLMLILFGAIVRSRPLALLGATAVVLLNVGRVVAGLANVLVVPFRDGIFPGIMFLIPPLTFFYLNRHWGKLKKPTMRVVTPILTIALVFVAFTVIPSLRRDGKGAATADLPGELREEVRSLEGEMIGEIEKARAIDLDALEKGAATRAREAAGRLNSIGRPGVDK